MLKFWSLKAVAETLTEQGLSHFSRKRFKWLEKMLIVYHTYTRDNFYKNNFIHMLI